MKTEIKPPTETARRIIGRALDAPLQNFDLRKLLSQIKREEAWRKSGHNAIILHKSPGLRVMLVALVAGASIHSHSDGDPISVQAIEGSFKFNTDAGNVRLEPGQMLTLQAGIRHDIEAIEETAFLLTIASRHPSDTDKRVTERVSGNRP